MPFTEWAGAQKPLTLEEVEAAIKRAIGEAVIDAPGACDVIVHPQTAEDIEERRIRCTLVPRPKLFEFTEKFEIKMCGRQSE